MQIMNSGAFLLFSSTRDLEGEKTNDTLSWTPVTSLAFCEEETRARQLLPFVRVDKVTNHCVK